MFSTERQLFKTEVKLVIGNDENNTGGAVIDFVYKLLSESREAKKVASSNMLMAA